MTSLPSRPAEEKPLERADEVQDVWIIKASKPRMQGNAIANGPHSSSTRFKNSLSPSFDPPTKMPQPNILAMVCKSKAKVPAPLSSNTTLLRN
ncbi:unnamed protein product [Aureobasidium pullulans]|nr:unnamed protein product [Aureobasidium pullulans]